MLPYPLQMKAPTNLFFEVSVVRSELHNVVVFHLQQSMAIPVISTVTIHSLKGKLKPSLHARVGKANMEARFLLHSGPAITSCWLDLLTQGTYCKAPWSKGTLGSLGERKKQELYMQQAVGTTWHKLYTQEHTHSKKEFAWVHWYHVFKALSSAGLDVSLLLTPVLSAYVNALVRWGRKWISVLHAKMQSHGRSPFPAPVTGCFLFFI